MGSWKEFLHCLGVARGNEETTREKLILNLKIMTKSMKGHSIVTSFSQNCSEQRRSSREINPSYENNGNIHSARNLRNSNDQSPAEEDIYSVDPEAANHEGQH